MKSFINSGERHLSLFAYTRKYMTRLTNLDQVCQVVSRDAEQTHYSAMYTIEFV